MADRRLRIILNHLRGCEHPLKLFSSEVSATEDQKIESDISHNSVLTPQQLQFYKENGYLVVPKLVSNSVLDECHRHFIDICEHKIGPGNMWLMKELSLMKTGAVGEHLYYKVQELFYDDVFWKYCAYPKLLDYVECFIGNDITGIHSMLINKPPDARSLSSRHPLHQDLLYFPLRPVNKIVGAWTAMEEISADNGCLIVLPGTHKNQQLYRHDYPDWEGGMNKAFHGVLGFDDHITIPLCMEKGDTVFLHPLLIHGSGANLTKGFRKAISCHYASSDCNMIQLKGTIQENIALEMESIVLKKHGVVSDYEVLFKNKCRLIRGAEGFTSC